MAASAHAASVMQWTFDTNNQGWSPSFGAADGSATTWVSSGGNPGGYVHSSDSFSSAVWHFGASPNADVSAAFGGTLSFDLESTGDRTGPLLNSGGNIRDTYDVSLAGNGITLMIDKAIAPPGTWTPFSIDLDAAAGWLRLSGPGQVAATDSDIQQVLASLQTIEIRGGYYTGTDVTGLDNVSFNAPAPATTSAPLPPVAVAALLPLVLVIRKKKLPLTASS
jgi:hypothetical protein